MKLQILFLALLLACCQARLTFLAKATGSNTTLFDRKDNSGAAIMVRAEALTSTALR